MALPPDTEHLPGCPAAISVPGFRDDCRCSELATLFEVPTPEECFGERDPERARARWAAAHAEADRRYQALLQDLATDERRAMERYREAASGAEVVDKDIEKARSLLARMLAERDRRIL